MRIRYYYVLTTKGFLDSFSFLLQGMDLVVTISSDVTIGLPQALVNYNKGRLFCNNMNMTWAFAIYVGVM